MTRIEDILRDCGIKGKDCTEIMTAHHEALKACCDRYESETLKMPEAIKTAEAALSPFGIQLYRSNGE